MTASSVVKPSLLLTSPLAKAFFGRRAARTHDQVDMRDLIAVADERFADARLALLDGEADRRLRKQRARFSKNEAIFPSLPVPFASQRRLASRARNAPSLVAPPQGRRNFAAVDLRARLELCDVIDSQRRSRLAARRGRRRERAPRCASSARLQFGAKGCLASLRLATTSAAFGSPANGARDGFLRGVVVVVLDLLVVVGLPVDEHADADEEIVGLVDRDDALGDGVGHRHGDARCAGPNICTACLAPLIVTLLNSTVLGLRSRFGATTASSVVKPSLLLASALANAARPPSRAGPMIRSMWATSLPSPTSDSPTSILLINAILVSSPKNNLSLART